MSDLKLTNSEARRLLDMTKRSLIAALDFPNRGEAEDFDVIGDTKTDVFVIRIHRGNINPFKYSLGARIKKNGTILLELDIGPTNIHYNPDGEKICGDHWHVYTEEFGRSQAFPADDIRADSFIENTMAFLTKFNVVDPPEITYQLEII